MNITVYNIHLRFPAALNSLAQSLPNSFLLVQYLPTTLSHLHLLHPSIFPYQSIWPGSSAAARFCSDFSNVIDTSPRFHYPTKVKD